MVKRITTPTPQTLKTQHDMKLQYCKPETEVDLLVLDEFILYNMTNSPEIKNDLEYDDIDW